jgi:hypothetical protein
VICVENPHVWPQKLPNPLLEGNDAHPGACFRHHHHRHSDVTRDGLANPWPRCRLSND